MGQKPLPPPPPPKPLKELVKQFQRTISRQRRDFQREIYKLQANERKIKSQLEKMIKKDQPISSKRIIAQNLLRNQRFIQRYQKLDVQLQDMSFQLKTVATTDTLVNVMKGMAQMMGVANSSLNIKNIEQAMTMFQTEMQKGQIMAEQIEDVMDNGQQQIDDEAADNLIAQMQLNSNSGSGGGNNVDQLNDFEQRLNSIK